MARDCRWARPSAAAAKGDRPRDERSQEKNKFNFEEEKARDLELLQAAAAPSEAPRLIPKAADADDADDASSSESDSDDDDDEDEEAALLAELAKIKARRGAIAVRWFLWSLALATAAPSPCAERARGRAAAGRGGGAGEGRAGEAGAGHDGEPAAGPGWWRRWRFVTEAQVVRGHGLPQPGARGAEAPAALHQRHW